MESLAKTLEALMGLQKKSQEDMEKVLILLETTGKTARSKPINTTTPTEAGTVSVTSTETNGVKEEKPKRGKAINQLSNDLWDSDHDKVCEFVGKSYDDLLKEAEATTDYKNAKDEKAKKQKVRKHVYDKYVKNDDSVKNHIKKFYENNQTKESETN